MLGPKMRRVYEEGRFSSLFERSRSIRFAIGILSISIILNVVSYASDKNVELLLMTLLVLLSAFVYLRVALPEVARSNSRVLLLAVAGILNLMATKVIFVLAQPDFTRFLGNEVPIAIYLAPAFAPMLLSTLIGPRVGIFVTVFMSIQSAIMLNFSFPLLVISLLTGLMAVYFTQDVRRRSHLIRAGVYVGLTSMICALSVGFLGVKSLETIISYDLWHTLIQQCFGAVLVGIMTALLVSGLLPIFEYFFKITTNISWLELSDFNHPLLKEMSTKAAGTYHHSLNVANLAESAAEAIGANALMCRVASCFHDIGKLVKPEYFVENINIDHNPHDKLTPQMSALIISAHVKEGVALALKYKLNNAIIDIIREHHGTSLIYYFYRRAKQQEQDSIEGSKIFKTNEDDVPKVDENTFRYQGPKPQTRESGIITICDTLEAASRSLQKPTPQRIEELVREIIEAKLLDGQLDETSLTMKDLNKIGERLTFMITNMLHTRISYPKDDENQPSTKTKITSISAFKN